jgi:hypothetical protein
MRWLLARGVQAGATVVIRSGQPMIAFAVPRGSGLIRRSTAKLFNSNHVDRGLRLVLAGLPPELPPGQHRS